MNTHTIPQSAVVRRKIHYVDHAVQKWLVAALLALEVILVSAALWMIYIHLSEIIDQNLYRIHQHDGPSMFSQLLGETLTVLAGLVAANVLALLIADRIWGSYLHSILAPFGVMMARVEALDFGEDQPLPRSHETLELALAWRSMERLRCKNIRDEIAGIDPQQDFADPQAREKLRVSIERLRGLLPPV